MSKWIKLVLIPFIVLGAWVSFSHPQHAAACPPCSEIHISPTDVAITAGGGTVSVPLGDYTLNPGDVLSFEGSSDVPTTRTFELVIDSVPTGVSSAIPGILTYTIPAPGGILSVELVVSDGTDDFTFTYAGRCGESTPPEEGSSEINDGRLNRKDVAAPVVLYFPPTGLQIYAVGPDSQGTLVLTISQETIDEVGIPVKKTLLGEAVNPFSQKPIQVYRLPSGEFMLRTYEAKGKSYVVVWKTGEEVSHPEQ